MSADFHTRRPDTGWNIHNREWLSTVSWVQRSCQISRWGWVFFSQPDDFSRGWCWGPPEHLLSVCKRNDNRNLCGGQGKEGNYTAIDLEQISTDGWFKKNSKGPFRSMSVIWLHFQHCLMSSIRKLPGIRFFFFLSQKNDTRLAEP